MNAVIRVVTRKSGPAYPWMTPFRVQIVEAIREWCGYVPQVQLRKLRTRTIILTDEYRDPKPAASLAVRGVGTYDLLSDVDVAVSMKTGVDFDMIPINYPIGDVRKYGAVGNNSKE